MLNPTRIQVGTPGTLTVVFGEDSEPIDADDNAVIATVKDLDGTTVASGSATHGATGTYSFVLPPQDDVTALTATFAGEFSSIASAVVLDVEIVGGFFFTLAELRGFDSALSAPKYTADKLAQARLDVEAEFEDFCHRAFVRRFARESIYADGSGALWLSNPQILAVQAIKVDGEEWTDTVWAPDSEGKELRYTNSWPPAGSTVLIDYEYGMDNVPPRIKRQALIRARDFATDAARKIDDRAITMTNEQGTFRLSTPGRNGAKTGIPSVDVVLDFYDLDGGSDIV